MHHTFAFKTCLPETPDSRHNRGMMVRQSIRVFLALLWAAVPAIAAWAQIEGDTDGDGRLSAEEFRNRAAKIAFGADANGNGAIDPPEYPFRPGEAEAFDSDRDGKVQIQEFQKGLMDAFASLDTNGDGFLDAREQRSSR